MTRPAATLRALLARFRGEAGTATVEFVILFPAFMLLFLSVFELAVVMTRQTFLERAMELSARSVRVGELAPVSHESLKAEICANASFLPDCTDTMLLEMRPVSKDTWNVFTEEPTCTDRSEEVQPVTQFNAGGDDEWMLLRACVIVDPFFPTTGLALHLPTDDTGGFAMLATSAFVNEPS